MDGGIVDQQGPDGAGIAAPFPDSPAARVASFAAGGGRAVVILCPSRTMRAAVLDGVLAALPSQAMRAGNPLASPLTLHRLMFQLGAGAADGDDDGLLARRLDGKTDTSALAVLAVDDAQTLAADALAALAQVPSPAAGGHPGRLLILAGHPDLLLALFKPGLHALHDPANALLVDLDGVETGVAQGIEGAPDAAHTLSRTHLGMSDAVPMPGAAMPAPPAPDQPARPVLRRTIWRRLARPVLAALALGAAASVVLALSWDKVPAGPDLAARAGFDVSPPPASPRSPVPAPMQEPPPAQAVIQPFAPASPIPETQGVSPVPRQAAMPSDADLRRGFDAFLDRAGRDTAGLSPADRAALFREYLDWRSRSAARPAR
ncbi:MAG: hypothetical protein ACRYGM_28665 [Janthinobacterium lividum]